MKTPGSRAAARDLIADADEAERAGDLSAAASKLRSHLAQRPDDAAVRLRLGRTLLSLGELASARDVVQPLEEQPDTRMAAATNKLLATLDEAEGALTSAQIRWERALADDIDDPEARAHLGALRPDQDAPWPSNLSLATLVSPEGVQTSRF
ncbi:MAG: tetratricopeptide repeat protein, partial [Haliangium ochraceum]